MICEHLTLCQLKYNSSHALDDIKHCERGHIIIKIKTQNLLGMGVDCRILKAPAEGHDKCECIVLILVEKCQCEEDHQAEQNYVYNHRFLRPELVNYISNEEAPKYFSKAKKNHRNH